MPTVNQHLNSLMIRLAQHEQEKAADPESDEYQKIIEQINIEHAEREMLPQLRAMKGREY